MIKPTNKNLCDPSLGSHLRAVGWIALKDWKFFWRYPSNIILQVIQPVIWLVPVFFMGQAFSVNGQAAGFAGYSGTSDYMSFVLLGNALSNFISAVFWGMGYAIKGDMDTGVLESNWLAPLPRVLILVGHTLSSLVQTAISSAGMLLVAGLLFGFHPTGNAVAAGLVILPMLLGLYGFGLAFAALVMVLREANTLVDISSFLVTTFSGANFPVQSLPRWLLPVSLALPLTYGFDAMRTYLLGTTPVLPVKIEIGILVVFMGVCIFLGLKVFAALERRVRQRGTLGMY
jgi:ABC-2 type transport system permease protein